MTWDGSNDGVALHDGVSVLFTFLINKGQKTVSFPNYLWSKETIIKSLKDVGFSAVEWHMETDEVQKDNLINSSLGDVKEWIIEANKDLGLCGYFVAQK